MRAVLFAIALCACSGKTEPSHPRDPDYTSGLDETVTCPNGEAACAHLPQSPMVRPVNGVIRHWSLDVGCIRVTVEPTLLDENPAELDWIRYSVLSWRDLECVRLCLLDPELSDEPLDTDCVHPSSCEPRIHFGGEHEYYADEVLLTSDPCTGTIHAALILYASIGRTSEIWGIRRALATTLGLQAPSSGGSILREHSSIMDQDVTAMCTLYGTPAWCE